LLKKNTQIFECPFIFLAKCFSFALWWFSLKLHWTKNS
jgi:hypothetical protein